jgi:hypothetical protein
MARFGAGYCAFPSFLACRFSLFRVLLWIIVFILPVSLSVASWAGEGFQPISAEELKLTNEPLAPGAPAVILYREVNRDDSVRGDAHQYNYFRIKVLTEEGRKYANVELAFLKGIEDVVRINARSIKPDGTVINFDGNVFERPLAKARGREFLAKTFTLPVVEIGSIIEYFYTVDLKQAYDSHWILSEDLFTKTAQFSLKPFTGNSYVRIHLRWSWQGLQPGAAPKEDPGDRIIRMTATNIPAFHREDFMPPENELKARVDFIYDDEPPENDPGRFWQRIGKSWNSKLESFVGKPKAMEQAVGEIVSPSDPPELKLRKIYDRVQQIRNKSYEIMRTQQEEKRSNEKADLNVEDVWKRGYGSGIQLTWLYLALVRAAGFEAYGCWVSNRRQYFFNPKTMQSAKLNSNLVQVKLNGNDLYFDPGAELTPFGMLTWSETGVPGLRLDKNGGTWIQTPLPKSSESRIQRKADLKLSDAGDLDGKLTVTYTGLDAMYHRLDVRNADDVARKKFLEDRVTSQIPVPAEVELTNKPDWTSSETPLVAEFELKVQGWASSAGKRVTIAAGLFTNHEKHIFQHADRVYPIYIDYPYEAVDDLTVQLPPGWQVVSVPAPRSQDGHVVYYDLKVDNDKSTLHLSRKLAVDFLLLDQKYYTALRNFFEVVRTGDEEQIVLQPGTATAGN